MVPGIVTADRIEGDPPVGGQGREVPWTAEKETLARELLDVARRIPIVRVDAIEDLGEEIRAVVVLGIRVLVTPIDGAIRTSGPVTIGLRYHRSFTAAPPLPEDLVTVIEPGDIFHPGADRDGRLRLGPLPLGVRMDSILRRTHAVLTLSFLESGKSGWANPEAVEFILDQPVSISLLSSIPYPPPPAPLRIGGSAWSRRARAGGDRSGPEGAPGQPWRS